MEIKYLYMSYYCLGIQRKVFCKCQHGLCTPTEMESDQNSCEVLCGVDPCSIGN